MKKVMVICFIVCLLSVDVIAGYTEGFVDMDNLRKLAAEWLDPADLDDFAFLAAYWLTDQTPPDPNVWWRMEEKDGNVVFDADPTSGNDLVPAGGFVISEATTAGRIDNGMKFFSNRRLVNKGLDSGAASPGVLDIFPDELTIMGWIRPMPGNSTSSIWISKLNTDTTPSVPNTHSELYLRAGSNSTTGCRIEFRLGSTSNQRLNSNVTLQDNTWYHYAFTWDADGMAIYIDGELKNTNTADITKFVDIDVADGGGYDMHVGSGWVHVSAFTGMIDDVRIYETVLSAAQIKNIYDSTPPLVLYELVVNGGTGGGAYLNEVVVDIAADDPPAGYVFAGWTGDTQYVADAADPTTTVYMPAAPVTVTATYEIPTVISTLTVEGGTGSGDYAENAVVDIVANTPDPNDIFTGWIGDIANVADANALATTITMPGVDTTVTATYANRMDLLLAYWNMDDTEGKDANDLSGNGYLLNPAGLISDISDVNTPDGKFGGAFVIPGDGSRFEHPTLLDDFPKEITIAAWVRPDATDMTASMCWFSKQNAGTSPGPAHQMWLSFGMSGGAPGIIQASGRSDGTFFNCNTTITWVDDTWYHYVFTWDAGGMKIYVDGEPAASNGTPVMGDGTAINMSIGTGGATSQKFKGTVDEVRIYEAVLTAQQVKELYNLVP